MILLRFHFLPGLGFLLSFSLILVFAGIAFYPPSKVSNQVTFGSTETK